MDSVTVTKNRCYPDERGKLYVAELGKDLPFVVKRVYYISGVTSPETVRGNHAHMALRQLMFCVGGSCEIMFDNGWEQTTVLLDDPSKSIIVEPGVWREIKNFTPNATLVVLASETYDEADYIRDYDQFIKYIREGAKE